MGEEEGVDETEIEFNGFRTVQGHEVEETGRHPLTTADHESRRRRCKEIFRTRSPRLILYIVGPVRGSESACQGTEFCIGLRELGICCRHSGGIIEELVFKIRTERCLLELAILGDIRTNQLFFQLQSLCKTDNHAYI